MRHNHVEMNNARLEHYFNALQEQEQAGYLTDARKEQIRQEMAYIAFEGLMRQREMNEKEAITGQLELNYKGM